MGLCGRLRPCLPDLRQTAPVTPADAIRTGDRAPTAVSGDVGRTAAEPALEIENAESDRLDVPRTLACDSPSRPPCIEDRHPAANLSRLADRTVAIFDAFPDDAGRDADLSGKVAKALLEKAPELLAEPPKIEKADVLADR